MDNYKESLSKLVRRLAASRFLRWWLGELASMVPRQLRQAGPDISDFALVGLGRTDVILRELDGGKLRDVSRFPLNLPKSADQRTAFLAALDKRAAGKRDVALMLPQDLILRKTLVLPLATEENLRQVLEFQMEQHTPFTPGQIYFGYRVSARDFEQGQLKLEFVATPRDMVDEAAKTLAGWGVQVRALIAEDMLASGEPVDMLPAAQGKAPSRPLQGASLWLAGGVLLLALAALATPLAIKREVVLQLNPWVEKSKKAAEATDALRRELETRVEQHNYLLEKKRALPPVIVVLEELTRILPDDTWVQQVDIKGKEIQIQGETASSSRLISLFEQSGMFHDASFRSPLTKGQGAGTEHYHLALEIRPLPEQPAAKPQTPPATAAPGEAEGKQPTPAMGKKKP